MPASMLYRLYIENPTKNCNLKKQKGGNVDPSKLAREERVKESLDQRSKLQQFDLDAALWYGAIHTGPWSVLLRKIFHIFYHAGVMFNRKDKDTDQGGWEDWGKKANVANVAALLSHGQRVLVQIPSIENGGADLWTWLNQPQEIPKRKWASHGQSSIDGSKDLINGHHQYVQEKKGPGQAVSGRWLGRHFGVNVALGGVDNRNPTSKVNDDENYTFKRIKADGQNGHVYINYMRPEQGKVGGMLIGCENTAPNSGDNPHTDAGHSYIGSAQKIAVTGGKKWKQMTELGPRDEYNGFICDLVDSWQNNLDWLTSLDLFDPNWLDRRTREVAVIKARVVAKGHRVVA